MRVMVFDHRESYLFDLSLNEVAACSEVEEVNGEHYLSITTSQRLQQGQRLVAQKETGRWREYVVLGIDELHDSGRSAMGTYYAVWSPQYDLSTVYADDVEVGGERDAPALTAMEHALDGTSRWQVGRADDLGAHTMEMFGNSAWERVCDVVSTYGGELDWDVAVDFANSVRISSRRLNLVRQLGSQKVTRRFDWGHDVASIRRKPQEVPNCCRIIPVGNGDDVTLDGLVLEGRTEHRYLEDAEAALAFRYPDGKGGYEYPTRKVKFDIDGDLELLEYATEHLQEHTRPTPTYEANVIQYAVAGMDVAGVGLGDVVHVVDRGFNPDAALRVEGRVVKVVTNLLDPTDVQLTIGQLGHGLGDLYKRMQADMKSIRSNIDKVTGGNYSTKEYLDWLFEQLNSEINATGGWTYIVPGEGILTYDKEVVDPLSGMGVDGKPANQVVQIKGGSIRIANSRKSAVSGIDGWNWRTVLESGHMAADMVTASQITTGYIGDADGSFFIDLDHGIYRMPAGTQFGGKTVEQASSSAAASAAESVADALNKSLDQAEIIKRLSGGGEGLFVDKKTGHLYISAQLLQTGVLDASLVKAGILSDAAGVNFWNMNTGEFSLSPNTKVGGDTLSSLANVSFDKVTQEQVFDKLTNNGATKGIALTGGELYINATYLNSGILEVRDANGNTIFEANMGTAKTGGSVYLAGFTAKNGALYNGPSSMSSTAVGIYVGTDGIMSSNGSGRLKFTGGEIQGYQGTALVGTIDPNANLRIVDDDGNPTGEVLKGLSLKGGMVEIKTPWLSVLDSQQGTSHKTWNRAITVCDLGSSITGYDNGNISVAPRAVEYGIINGMLVSRYVTTYDRRLLASKSYVDGLISDHSHSVSDVSGLQATLNSIQTALNGKLSSGDLSGYATQAWVNNQGFMKSGNGYATETWVKNQGYAKSSSVPTFSQSNGVLTITF